MAKPTRNTRQKEILKDITNTNKSLFTAQELCNKAQKKDSTIGIATIYRYLKEQTKKGKFHTYTCNNKTIYSTTHTSHCHFTCEQCKETKHIHITNIDFIDKNIQDKICHFQIDLSGTCQQCLNKER